MNCEIFVHSISASTILSALLEVEVWIWRLRKENTGTKMMTCMNLCLKILNQSSTYISRYHPKNHHTITLERLIRCSAITHCNNSELVRVRDTPGSLRNREQSESYCVLRKRKEKWEITCKCGFDAVTEKFVKIGSWLRPPINHLQERQLQVYKEWLDISCQRLLIAIIE